MKDLNRLHRRTQIMIAVNQEADKFYSKSQDLGLLAAETFQEQNSDKKNKHRAQMTGLENIAETTMKVSDVLDYIKKQTARPSGWQRIYKERDLNKILQHYQEYEEKCFGAILKDYIEQDLKTIRDTVCSSISIGDTTDEDKRDRQQVYLHLIRQLVRQIVVQYEYRVSELDRIQRLESSKE